jgi:hypothetical protein
VSTNRHFEHLSGREYLAVIRGQRREPPRPYTFDLKGLTPEEQSEVYQKTPEFSRLRLNLTADWETP